MLAARVACLVSILAVSGAALAHAETVGPPPPVVGATVVTKVTPVAGFVDDAVTGDDGRLVYVVADAGTMAEAHVVTLATGDDAVVDLSRVTLHPLALRLVGSRLLVIGTGSDDDAATQTAALVEIGGKGKPASGSVVYRVGPASHITVITRDGHPRLAVERTTTAEDGIAYQAELYAIETGRRLAVGRPLKLDNDKLVKALDFHVNHWADGMTRAIGIKAGEWSRKDDMRAPDYEATYDLLTGTIVERHAITDLFEQHKRYQALADAGGVVDFIKPAWDNSGLELWHAGKPRVLELDQPLTAYDPKSLIAVVAADGSAWFSLKIDPVNPEAVARKKADPEYVDIFRATTDGKATRRARVLAPTSRDLFGVIGDAFWLLERNTGFDRGGRALTLYRLAPS